MGVGKRLDELDMRVVSVQAKLHCSADPLPECNGALASRMAGAVSYSLGRGCMLSLVIIALPFRADHLSDESFRPQPKLPMDPTSSRNPCSESSHSSHGFLPGSYHKLQSRVRFNHIGR